MKNIILLIIGIILIYGWVLNLIKIADWNESIGMIVVRIIGAFTGVLGSILGFI